jgi:hypothetical protein
MYGFIIYHSHSPFRSDNFALQVVEIKAPFLKNLNTNISVKNPSVGLDLQCFDFS